MWRCIKISIHSDTCASHRDLAAVMVEKATVSTAVFVIDRPVAGEDNNT